MEQNRWKSPVLWSGIASQIVAMLIFLKVIDTGMGDSINNVVAAICQLWTVFSQANNPASKTSF